MRRLVHILIVLCLPTLVVAQTGVRFDSYNVTSANNTPYGSQATLFTLPFSSVTVCAYPDDGGQPCGNTIPIYSDPALTQTADNPVTADVHGRFGFWLAQGTYTYSVVTQGGQFVGTYIFTLGGSGGTTGCATGGTLTPNGQLIYNDAGNCASSPNITVVSPSTSQDPLVASDEIQINNVHRVGGFDDDINLYLQSGVDPDNNFSWFAPHYWNMHCTNSGLTTLGCGLNLLVSDSEAPSGNGGLNPIAIDMSATQDGSHPGYIGMLVTQHGGSNSPTISYQGFQLNGPRTGTYRDTIGYLIDTGQGATTGGAFGKTGYLALVPDGSLIASDYCAVRTADDLGNAFSKIECGPTHTSTFNGPVTLNGPLALGSASQGGTMNALEGPAATAASGHDVLYADSTTHCLKYSANGGTFHCITASISFALDASAVPSISAGSCTNLSVSSIADIDSTTALSLSLAGPTANVNAAAAALTWNVYYDATLSQIGYTFCNRSVSTWTNPGTLSVNIGRLH